MVFEELGGDASKIVLMKRSLKTVCADVYENHPAYLENNIITQSHRSEAANKRPGARVHLSCAPGQTISSVKFASFGTPTGTCGSFQTGSCHAPGSHAVIEKVSGNQQILLHIRIYPCIFWCFLVMVYHEFSFLGFHRNVWEGRVVRSTYQRAASE